MLVSYVLMLYLRGLLLIIKVFEGMRDLARAMQGLPRRGLQNVLRLYFKVFFFSSLELI